MPGMGSPDMSPTRLGASGRYGYAALLNFLFKRVTRSGPRLLFYMALAITFFIIVIKFITSRNSESISTNHLWTSRPSLGHRMADSTGAGEAYTLLPPGKNNARDALAGDGLRIVVFGEHDIATSTLQNTPVNLNGNAQNGTSWTREMCIELGCSTYQSFVPRLDEPRRSLVGSPLYGGLIEDTLRATEEEDANPANDYSNVSDAPSIDGEAPDVFEQVSNFLSQPAPKRAPKETIFVFSFGMWDVWSLAAYPYSSASSVVSALVADIFTSIEKLYDAAHDPTSVAYSNYTTQSSRRAGSGLLWHDDRGSEPFRVVMPLLFDPSMVPGWHLSRPDAPNPDLHTKPEQLLDVVRLTKHWNDEISDAIQEWTRKGVEFVHPDVHIKEIATAAEPAEAAEGAQASQSPEQEKMTELKKHSVLPPPNLSARHARRDSEGQNPDTHPGAGVDKAVHKAAISATPLRSGEPVLARDGIVFRLPEYVMDMVIDSQMKQRGMTDRKAFGKLPTTDVFSEVGKPCLMPTSVGLSPVSQRITTEVRRSGVAEKNGDVKDNYVQTRDSVALGMCKEPDQHLFFTSYSLGQRAIEELGRLSAAVVRATPSTRSGWEEVSRSTGETAREPGSWKTYYTSAW